MWTDLDAIPGWVKVKVFDALVKEFSGKEKFSHMQRVMIVQQDNGITKTETCGVCNAKFKDIPVYKVEMRMAGCSDFTQALLDMVKEK